MNKTTWQRVKLGEMIKTNCKSIDKNYPYNIVQYLDTGSITDSRIESLQNFDLKDLPSRAKRLVQDNDIIYSLVRPIQRHFGFIKNPSKNLVVSTGFCTITTHQNILDSKFLYYFLILDETIEFLDLIAEASTSAYPAIKPSDIENLIIPLPPLETQHKIAEILSSLDDKIDLLHRQNKTRESLSLTLFRHIFIDNPKCNEWEEIKIGDYVECVNGYSYKSSELDKSNIALVTLKNFARDGSFNVNGFKEFIGTRFKDSQIVENGDLIVAHTDITQEAEIIGNPALVIDIGQFEKLIITMDLVKVESKIEWLSKEFLYYLFKTQDFKSHCLGNSNGTTVLHMNRKTISEYTTKIPNSEIIMDFTKKVSYFLKKSYSNLLQIQSLQQMRDIMLPKLLSGEVEV